MKIKIEEKKENPLLNHQDIGFLVEHTGTATPPRLDVRAKLAAMLNCKEDQLYIIKLNGLYGQSSTQGYARLYPSKESAVKQEQAHIIKRHSTEEVAPPEAAPTPVTEEAAPAPKEVEVKEPPKKEEVEVKEPPKKEEKAPPKKKEEVEVKEPPKKETKAAKKSPKKPKSS